MEPATAEEVDSLIDRAWHAFDRADPEPDPVKRAKAFDELVAWLSDRISRVERTAFARSAAGNPKMAGLLHALGYIFYCHPGRRGSLDLQLRTESAPREALRFDPAHAYARSHLGYNAYDLGRYGDAERWFLSADCRLLDPWDAFKLREIVVCCCLRLRPRDCVGSLEELVQECRSWSIYDVQPLNLSRAVSEMVRDGAVDDAVAKLLRELDSVAGFSWFRRDLEGCGARTDEQAGQGDGAPGAHRAILGEEGSSS